METAANGKISASHLARNGYVYIRQSTTHQVVFNKESTERQYQLKERLRSLGWPEESIITIDSDLGISGKSTEGRDGFSRLLADVAMGKAGAIASIEASRLSRCSADWSRLVEICTMTETLVIDADGIYDPNDFNDRLLLGLKGTMSEAELHFLQQRMRGGLLNKAKKGELKRFLPIGYEYDPGDRVVKTADIQVREAVAQFFDLFRTLKSGYSVVNYYAENEMQFPFRLRIRGHYGEIKWGCLNEERATAILHNPFYYGVYTFGRTQTQWTGGGKRRPVPMPEEKWHACIPDHHEAYITKEEFDLNQAILKENSQQWKGAGKHTPPREGQALLQGICYCGKCGKKMFTTYGVNHRKEHYSVYRCSGTRANGPDGCSVWIPAGTVDEAVSQLIEERITPEALSLTEEIATEIQRRKEDHLRYYKLQVANAEHEEQMARLRFMGVDPTNALVRVELEALWNEKLRLLSDAKKILEEETLKSSNSLTELSEYKKIIEEKFSAVWNSPALKHEDRKRIVRHILQDVTLIRNSDYTVTIQMYFQGGATEQLTVPIPRPRWREIETPREVIEFLDREAEHHSYTEMTQMLNEQGYKRACGRAFRPKNVHRIMKDYGIKSLKQRYLDRGWITTQEMAERFGITAVALRHRIKEGLFHGEYIIVEERRGTMLFNPESVGER